MGKTKNTTEFSVGVRVLRNVPHVPRIWKCANNGLYVGSHSILSKQKHDCEMLLNVHGIDSVLFTSIHIDIAGTLKHYTNFK